MPPAIFLLGPTASGKTALAVALVKEFPLEIISVDSALVYRQMDIGTAKPSAEVLAVAPHHLLDILDPAQSYSAAHFCSDALALMQKISAAGRVPLLVGGTGLYFRALEQGLSVLPKADEDIRERLLRDAAALGWGVLHQRLAQLDPQAAQRIHPNDPQRIQRALEICELSGESMTVLWQQQHTSPLPYRVCKLVLAPPQRQALHERIAQRFQNMLAAGLVAEVEALYQRGDLDLQCPSMRCVGYRQVWQYLAGELDYAQMQERGIIATRQLAKRQMTWLRRETEALWLNPLQADAQEKARAFVLKCLEAIPT